MTFIAILASEIAPVIAKTILKIWLNDRDIAKEVSLSIVDILERRTSDRFAQQKGKVDFESIGLAVAQQLEPLFSWPGTTLTPNGKEAVAQALADTLSTDWITPEILVSTTLDANKIAKKLMAANPHIYRDFSEPEYALYERALIEALRYIAGIATRIPKFTEEALAEQLRTGNLIRETVNQVLDEVQEMRSIVDQLDPDELARRFEFNYRRDVKANLDWMELYGMETSYIRNRHPLSIAYVSLSLKHHEVNDSKETDTEVEDLEFSEDISIEQLISTSRRLLITGSAGSGKTTILKWLAVKTAVGKSNNHLQELDGKVPFFIPLRSCVELGFPVHPENIPGFVGHFSVGEMPDGWVHEQLHDGRALLLIDGIDEVPAALRPDVYEWIEDLISRWSDIYYIATSRERAVAPERLNALGFKTATLQPMDVPSINVFIDQWYKAVGVVEDNKSKQDLMDLAQALKTAIWEDASIRLLAQNPLLCAALCAINRARRGILPQGRVKVLETCAQILIDRDRLRGLKIDGDYPELTLEQKSKLLADLAYHLLKNGLSEITKGRANQRLQQRMLSMFEDPHSISSDDVLRLLLDRTGMIYEPVPGQVDFTHRIFQEYLAASQAVADYDFGLLTNRANEDSWQEVVILAAGLARQPEADEMIAALIKRGDHEEKLRHQLHLLAIACLETAGDLDPKLRKELEKRLESLVPPSNMAEANNISAAGNLAVRHLSGYSSERVAVVAACVRALSLIGTDLALGVLEEYAHDHRKRVMEEIQKAWDHFADRYEFASKMWADAGQLSLSRPSTLEGIQPLTHLRILEVSDSPVNDLEPLKNLISLEELEINQCDWLADTKRLSGLPNLEKLSFKSCPSLNDISGLTDLPKLKTLNFTYCEELRAVDGLADLPNLTTVVFANCDNLRDLAGLAVIPSITTVELHFCPRIEALDFKPLALVKSLQSLSIGWCSNIDIDDLVAVLNHDLRSIQHLKIHSNQLTQDHIINLREDLAVSFDV